MKKVILALLFLLPVVAGANNTAVVNAVKESIQGTQITHLALKPIPHSTSMQMVINTDSGERSLILSRRHIGTAIKTLSNARLIGMHNALAAKPYLQLPAFKKYNMRVAKTGKTHTTKQIAMVNSTITAANQQASR